jgi:hypothetical protein
LSSNLSTAKKKKKKKEKERKDSRGDQSLLLPSFGQLLAILVIPWFAELPLQSLPL